MNINDTQNALVEYLKNLFLDYEINGSALKIHKNFVPSKKLENQSESKFPFMLLRYFKRKQKIENNSDETFYEFELLFAVDCGKTDDLTIEHNLYMMDKIEKDMFEVPVKSDYGFAINQKEIVSEIDYEAMYEANKSSFCYSYMKFQVFGDSNIPKLGEKWERWLEG